MVSRHDARKKRAGAFRTTLEIGAVSRAGTNGGERSDSSAGGRESSRSISVPTTEALPPFWEDQLFAETETSVVRFKIGDVAFEGSNPCARCPVPSRESQTGVTNDGFQKRFTELRRAQLPSWAPADRFDHFYRLAVNTRVPSTECGKLLRLGDPLIL